MKLTASKIDAYIKALPASLPGALVYGPDAGLVSQRAYGIADKIVPDISDPFSVVELSGESLAESAALADELSAMGLGGRRLVWIKDAPHGLGKIIAEAFATAQPRPEQVFLLVSAGDLPPAASLRKWFEAEKQMAALPCYQDDAVSLRQVINGALRARSLSADEDAIRFLQEACRGDRLMAEGNIEKLSLYLGNENRNAILADVLSCIGLAAESSFEDLCFAVAEGDQKALMHHLQRALWQGLPAVALLRSVQRYFLRLHNISGQMAHGMSQESAIAALHPPVFFKALPGFTRQAALWCGNPRRIGQALSLLYEAELSCKRTGANADLLCSRFLMRVAALARPVSAAA